MRDLWTALARNAKAAKWRVRFPTLSVAYRQFAAERSDEGRKRLIFELARQEGSSYQLDQLKDVIDELRAWQCFVLFMTEGLFGQVFTREQVAELAGRPVAEVHDVCGSVKFIRVRSHLTG